MSDSFISTTSFDSRFDSRELYQAADLNQVEHSSKRMSSLAPVCLAVAALGRVVAARAHELENVQGSHETSLGKILINNGSFLDNIHSIASSHNECCLSKKALRTLTTCAVKLEGLQEHGLLHQAVIREGGEEFVQAKSTLENLASSLAQGQRLDPAETKSNIAKAQHIIERSIQSGIHRAQRAEYKVIKKHSLDVLQAMGYRQHKLQRKQSKELIIGASNRNGASIYLKFEPQNGKLTFDMSGFNGVECQGEKERFVAGMAKRGIYLQILIHNRHGRKEGGELAQSINHKHSKEEENPSLQYYQRNLLKH